MYMERFRLDGKRAVVTGGGRGIGFGICEALTEAGAEVIIAEIDPETGEAAAQKLRDAGFKASSVVIDVSDSAAVTALADKLNAGSDKIDILINNAGIFRDSGPLDGSDDDWTATMKVNSDAAFWCSRAFGRHMVERKAGSIVSTGSICASVVTRPQNSIPYHASKGAIHMMTKSLACAWAESNVRVNAVAPAYTATEMVLPMERESPEFYNRWMDMTPMGRLAETSEIGCAVLFLASDAASYCTGSILTVDGGYTSW